MLNGVMRISSCYLLFCAVEGEFNSNAFEALERDFQDVLSELVGDKSLERFRLEYEKLHRALKKSHDQEKRLIKKVSTAGISSITRLILRKLRHQYTIVGN
jgi:hypothetical protein